MGHHLYHRGMVIKRSGHGQIQRNRARCSNRYLRVALMCKLYLLSPLLTIRML
ncbi:unnamed protein product [Haemonchus placei]|uniref:50S ribosomal protein L34 n=1 Tax=Haemonchus placei TaxID=6290 RepID=A0A0N4WJ06_HAEPC|nr:unnamed protein product [Haemonchus placei]